MITRYGVTWISARTRWTYTNYGRSSEHTSPTFSSPFIYAAIWTKVTCTTSYDTTRTRYYLQSIQLLSSCWNILILLIFAVRLICVICFPAAVVNWNKMSLSDAMLKELSDRCPNIKHLGLVMASVTSLSVTKLPPGLTSLSITQSFIPSGWFHVPNLLPELTELDLSDSTKTSSVDMKDIAKWTKLKVLRLNGCYRVKEEGLLAVAAACKSVTVLEIAETGVTDSAIHHLSRAMPGLTRLNLARCNNVNDGSMETITACLHNLDWIDVTGCKRLTGRGVAKLTAKTVISEYK